MSMRLQKYMAMCGVASRRKSEELIATGHVRVNGVGIMTPGHQIEPGVDQVEVDGKPISGEAHEYILLNKPMGVISTSSDVHAVETAVDLVKSDKRLYTVGRLDKDTEGLLVLTNDGDLTFRLTHPRHHFKKTYTCLVKGRMEDEAVDLLREGVLIDNDGEAYQTQPAEVTVLRRKRGATLISITISEGKNRQVRKMCEAVEHPVIQLKRVALGDLKDPALKAGKWRYLTAAEVDYLKGV
ncbi:MAG: pseudouridine synthase [Eubacterium aggregans]|jgi:23S rRNA pseudouridine2605 synthase|uniref:pseudouridine synthase n=1 Tax=Eubacterium aggregans TaxID=81409 RepID=UPI002B1F277D|nr:pseudouridine synthase [Eubacterium aggregans]MEA5072649.1 pseudouridine synthase [Eubacterium aggregans]